MQPEHNPQELLELAYKDDLTGLYNRRYFTRVVVGALDEPGPESPYCVFMLDIDFFKEINDSHGHQNGDRTLIALASLLKESFQGNEFPVRFAGDEFVVYLPNTSAADGIQKARDLVARGSELVVPLPGDSSPIRITLSVGVAGFPDHGAHWEEVMERADQALYAAKQGGRNRAALPREAGEDVRRGDDLSRIFPCPAYIGSSGPLPEILGALDALPHALKPEPLFLLCRGGLGYGKTRLLQEVARKAKERGIPVLRLSGTQQLEDVCYGSLVQGLVQHAGSPDALRTGPAGGAPSGDDDLWEIFFFHGAMNPEPLEAARAHGFFLRLLRGISGPQRQLVLAADDADSLDPDTLKLLQGIQRSSDPGFSCLCVMARTGEDGPQPDAGIPVTVSGLLRSIEQEAFGSLEIPPLSGEEMKAMVEAVFPTLRTDPSLHGELAARSLGNPLYVEEALKLMVRREALVYRRSAWNWTVESLADLPASLDALLEARLESLDPDVRALVQKASVLGTDIDPDLLAGIGPENEGYVLDLLERARKCGILSADDARWQEGAFHFNNGETRAISYDRIPEEDRIAWHTELARLHRSMTEGPAHLNLGALQHHYRLAGEEDAFRTIANRLAPLGPATNLSLPQGITFKRRKDSPGEPVALSQDNLAGVVSIFHLLRAAMQTRRLYPETSQAVARACERLHKGFLETLAHTPSVHLSEAEGMLLINGEALAWKGEERRVAETFCRTLSAVGLKDIVFLRGLALEEIKRFLKTWVELQQDPSDAPARWEAFETSPGMEHIQVNAKVYVALSETALFAGVASGEERDEPPALPGELPDLLASVRARLASLRDPGAGERPDTEEVERTRALLERIQAFLLSGNGDKEAAAGILPDPASARKPEAQASENEHGRRPPVPEALQEDDVRCALADILSGDPVRQARGYRCVSEAGAGAVEALYFTLTQTEDGHAGRLCARFLASLCPELASRLQEDLSRPADPAVKRRLLQYAVPVLEDPPTRTHILCSALKSEHGTVAMEALHQLETVSGSEAAPLLLAALPCSEARTRMEIYASLGRLGESACVPQLLETLETWKRRGDERTLRDLESACDALSHFNDPRIVQKLEELLGHRSWLPWRRTPPPGLRKAALKALLRIGGEPVASVLKGHQSDPDPWIRLRSRQFLQEHGHA